MPLKKFFLLLTTLLLAAASHAQIGSIGGTLLSWSISGGVLTISGSGAMPNNIIAAPSGMEGTVRYTQSPWYSYRSSIYSVVIAEGVTAIGSGAFAEHTSLTSVSIPSSVSAIGSYAFILCSSLASVSIPGSVSAVGERAFYGCSSLASVAIPSSVAAIGKGTFYGCGLTSIAIPNSVTFIDSMAFAACTSLTSVTLPSSITAISFGAFNGCTSLSAVVLPSSVTSIGYRSFAACTSLTSLTVLNPTPPAMSSSGDFDKVPTTCVLRVPDEASVSRYKAADGWKNFTTILPLNLTATFNSQDGSAVAAQSVNYNSTATTPTAPTRTGYAFGGWYKEAACTNAYAFATAVTANITLYAKWTVNTYSISYTLNGGTNHAGNPTSYTIESADITLQPPTRALHHFRGWSPDGGALPAGSMGNRTFTASWELYSYPVTFEALGGSSVAEQTVFHGSTAARPLGLLRPITTPTTWADSPLSVDSRAGSRAKDRLPLRCVSDTEAR